jgi:Kyakuja-Dileera-Zisupton transposase
LEWGAVHLPFTAVPPHEANSDIRAKYPLAVIEVFLEALGKDISGGYDIGCGFGTTLDQSLLGDLAQKMKYRSLVGSFHGHTHNNLCQLTYLATYVKGMGLEDLEGCEWFFSKSNALASLLHYASVFHQQQKIVELCNIWIPSKCIRTSVSWQHSI